MIDPIKSASFKFKNMPELMLLDVSFFSRMCFKGSFSNVLKLKKNRCYRAFVSNLKIPKEFLKIQYKNKK